MSTPQAFTISSEALARFPAAIQKTIVNVVQSELEKARSNCIQALVTPPQAEPATAQDPRTPMDEAWQREATGFVHSIEAFLNSCPSAKRGPNFKAGSKQILEDAFERSQFLNKAECRIVAKAAGLSSQQVRTWFQNKRNRSSKKQSKSESKSRSRSQTKKSAPKSTVSPPTSLATTTSRATSFSSDSSHAVNNLTGTFETVLGAESRVMLTVPHRVQEVGLAMEGPPAPVSSFEAYPATYGLLTSEVSAEEASLWLEGVGAATGSSPFHTSTTDSHWTRMPQSLWLQPYMDPSAAPLMGPLAPETAPFSFAASSFMDFQEPVGESS